ncbi:hypothetical protein [Frankia sp. AvcI1]|uniref:hypothetical protein n=1 Tax=Frankia sp. AvcI1 TaxID=573496 RepID=UPI0006EC22BF|nr:hypothetical protein [Frankia sp. AvcI1]
MDATAAVVIAILTVLVGISVFGYQRSRAGRGAQRPGGRVPPPAPYAPPPGRPLPPPGRPEPPPARRERPTGRRAGSRPGSRIRIIDPASPPGTRPPRPNTASTTPNVSTTPTASSSAAGGTGTHIQVQHGTPGCPVCADPITSGEAYVRCAAGHTHHRACGQYARECAVPHCGAEIR